MGLFDERSYSYDTTKSITELDTSSKEMEKEVEKIQSDPFSGGAPGLVPESTLDTQDKYLRGDGTWHTPAGGGGGGTENYEDLANKPAIDGTELSKDSTAEGLGLAKLTDLPDMSDVVHEDDLEPYAKKTDLPTVPTKVSELQNDSGYLTNYTETDPTVPSWAKAESKPTYSKSEVGLSNVDNTSDANKPVSTATQAALDLKQDKLTAGDGIDISAQNVISLNPTFGFTPVGTLIAVMGNAAPTNYLACNGQTVNIADYPELAAYFEQQFGTKNHFGGNGTTTFGIPDLRGEFLRGTGTNFHTNQGSGANVGVHQDATENLYIARYRDAINPDNNLLINSNVAKDNPSSNLQPINSDSNIVGRLAYHQIKITSSTVDSSQSVSKYTVRPTNTSVLYCIATKNIYLNPALDYSTSEKVVGHWIDGKPLYQKTIDYIAESNITLVANTGFMWIDTGITPSTLGDFATVECFRKFMAGSNKHWQTLADMNYTTRLAFYNSTNNVQIVITNLSSTDIVINSGEHIYCTLQYTKTTD